MDRVEPSEREYLQKMVNNVVRGERTVPLDFTEVEGTHFLARFTNKDGDMIFQFFGKSGRLPGKLPALVAKAFHEVLGDVGMERLQIEVLDEKVTKEGEKIEGGQTIFVRAKNYANPVAEKALIPRVFEIVQEAL